ncbi:MAG: acetyl esterase/lipase/S-formylglutathione hydrolase FrmB [Candidatus Latescibacterota bacterium]|jgi:acetyl esterase/lipase/S-formylglutathione hydrolase FrmB
MVWWRWLFGVYDLAVVRWNIRVLILGVMIMCAMDAESALPEGVRVEKDVVYGTVGDRELVLDLYWHSDIEKAIPLVIWVHGGAWRKGSKNNSQNVLPLLSKGYAVASVGYRLSGEAIFPAQIQDCKAGVRWLRAHAGDYQLDGEKFGVWGSSAGGHLVALLGTANDVVEWEVGGHLDVSSRVQAVCDWFGPTDFLRMNDVKGNIDHDAANSPESQLVGVPIQEHPDLVGNANPISYVSEDDPPFLIMHGGEDLTVIPNQSEFLNVALQEQGVSSTFVIVDDRAHGFGGERADIFKLVSGFFDEHLKDSESGWLKDNPNPWVAPCAPGVVGMRHVLFRSETLSKYYGYSLYLPPSYDQNLEQRFPVVYWLHGRGGNPNGVKRLLAKFDAAMKMGDCPEMVIVAPNGLPMSMYCDSKDGQYPVETVIVKDLISHVDATYRTVADRASRAIDGFSMGGFGAAHLGFKYPDLFGAVSIMGGALHKPEFLRDERVDIFGSVFGGNLDYCDANSPWTLVAQNADKVKTQVIRQYVGEKDDRLLEKNKAYHAFLEQLDIQHAFGIALGAGHNAVKVHENMADDPFAFYRAAFESKSC